MAAIATVAVSGVISKALAGGKDILVARAFGTGDAVDAFLMAFLLPSFAVNVLGGALNAAFVPAYVRVLETRGAAEGGRFLGSVIAAAMAVLLLATLVLALVGWEAIGALSGGFSAQKLGLARQLFIVLLPTIALAGLAQVYAAVLYAGGRFLLTSLSAAVSPIILGAVVLAVPSWGGGALAAGTLAGYGVELLALTLLVRRSGISVGPRWMGWTDDLRRFSLEFRRMVLGSVVTCGNPIVDQTFAASLGAGSVAVLAYGGKVPAVAVGLGATAIGTAVLPHFSQLVVRSEWAAIRSLLWRYGLFFFVGGVIAVAVGCYLSADIIGLFFRRGAFTAEDGVRVATVQSLLLLQLPFHVTGILFVRLITALSANRVLMWIGIWNGLANLAFNALLVPVLGLGGVALSTSAMYAVSFGAAALYCRRRLAAEERK